MRPFLVWNCKLKFVDNCSNSWFCQTNFTPRSLTDLEATLQLFRFWPDIPLIQVSESNRFLKTTCWNFCELTGKYTVKMRLWMNHNLFPGLYLNKSQVTKFKWPVQVNFICTQMPFMMIIRTLLIYIHLEYDRLC